MDVRFSPFNTGSANVLVGTKHRDVPVDIYVLSTNLVSNIEILEADDPDTELIRENENNDKIRITDHSNGVSLGDYFLAPDNSPSFDGLIVGVTQAQLNTNKDYDLSHINYLGGIVGYDFLSNYNPVCKKEVLDAKGNYITLDSRYRDIVVFGKGVALGSEGGPHACCIDLTQDKSTLQHIAECKSYTYNNDGTNIGW